MTYTMFDDANVAMFAGLTSKSYCFAGYVDGYVTFPWLLANRAGHNLLSITINAGLNAMCLDMEAGAASIYQAPSWWRRQKDRGIVPVLYCAAGTSSALIGEMSRAGVSRGSYLHWSAHIGRGEHICGPGTCGYPQADGTQWTWTALGRNLDQSILSSDFSRVFGGAKPPVPTPPSLPVLHEGATGAFVKTLQAALNKHPDLGTALAVDGDFGPKTEAHVVQFQKNNHLTVDGIVGPQTWGALGVTASLPFSVADNLAAQAASLPLHWVQEKIGALHSELTDLGGSL